MAGGIGSRFWPLSKTNHPKQFIDILGTGRTLIQQTFDRFNKIIPEENILFVTNEIYKDIVLEQLPQIKPDQVLLEPIRRNTAPCIAYANHKILTKNPNANIVVAPSDHLILKETKFINVVQKALDYVSKNKVLLTLGIQPSRIETGYGYIQVDGDHENISLNETICKVKTFTEKPDYKLAKIFFDSGEFYWNSGIFFWSLQSILDSFKLHLPEVDAIFKEGKDIYNGPDEQKYISEVYPHCKNISIDYGIMEKAENVDVLCSDFGWSDLGTWGSLHEHMEKDKHENAVSGKNILVYDSTDTIINAPHNKLVIAQGLEGYIVVESEKVLLICKKEEEQKIKQFVNDVKLLKGDDYL